MQTTHTRKEALKSYANAKKKYSWYDFRADQMIYVWYCKYTKRIWATLAGKDKYFSIEANDSTKESISCAIGTFPYCLTKVK